MKRLTDRWKALVEWFEYGDLLPLLIVVSAVHYTAILVNYDVWAVANAIGLLVDLGHYRWVRAAARYNGDNQRQAALRWLFALIMTVVSLAYHQRFYQDWWLSIPLPLLIASLAWLAKVDATVGKRKQPAKIATPVRKFAKEPRRPAKRHGPKSQKTRKPATPPPLYSCDCGWTSQVAEALGKDPQRAFAGHKKGCKHESNNGQ